MQLDFDNGISYFRNIFSNNISTPSEHKVGATFIGINTNISGKNELHIYICLFPFANAEGNVPYTSIHPNILLKDITFSVDENFYIWMYEEMRKQKSIIIMKLEYNILKVVEGFGDVLLNIDKNCNENKIWLDLEFKDWYEKKTFNNTFTIQIINPYLYMVPFPVKPIFLKTIRQNNNFITFSK